ncbi:hypothetical protein [Corynebacterium bovis]|uniref:Uncharacterized protein n=1 Tax=Corynebacterium bovis DSM 20582 = CIP 54.80 TaxID=927655 RepID=A0A8H9Y8P2_9CORY|nr:hypothetical protein [Corynebacterium bovis]MBB3116110.1 hypothetical protein [Corynebacterium bovis DSM 20582 = CIP 54.80]QQC47040.1 hypothetical protein I6I09_08165 [Corynebacterium bovis]
MGLNEATEATEKVLKVSPDHGHPSSLWGTPPRSDAAADRPYVTPEDFNLSRSLTQKIYSWTQYFQDMFITEVVGPDDVPDRFDYPPLWEDGADSFEWHRQGNEIVAALREELPEYTVIPAFDGYVYSFNETRRRQGLPRFVPGPRGR